MQEEYFSRFEQAITSFGQSLSRCSATCNTLRMYPQPFGQGIGRWRHEVKCCWNIFGSCKTLQCGHGARTYVQVLKWVGWSLIFQIRSETKRLNDNNNLLVPK